MAKYFGQIGFVKTVEDGKTGKWEEKIEERTYYGEITKTSKRWETSQNLNDDLTITNTLSVIMDGYVQCNLYAIRYATYMGCKWKVNSVEVQHPRMILHLGGIYNE